jgi:hypothetical protein
LAHGTGEIRDYARGVRGSHQLAQASVDLVSRMHNTPSNPEVLTTRKRVTVREKAEETSLPERLVGAARNRWIAGKLEDFASLLEQQGDGPFRPRAYRKAAATVASLPEPIDTILARQGRDGLISLPTIGAGIAAAIAEMAASGRWQQLDRLRGELTPEALVRTLPGIGPQLARRLCRDGKIETLEDLEAQLHLGSLDVAGLGPRRRAMLAASLAERLGRPMRAPAPQRANMPPISLLLQVDRMYRDRAAKGELKLMAPKRFNPAGEVWLPILHARHDAWHFTALYSNTRLAHELGRTRDWVVIYFHKEMEAEGRCTVVTETQGPRKGQRVVRGREDEVVEQVTPPVQPTRPFPKGRTKRSHALRNA